MSLSQLARGSGTFAVTTRALPNPDRHAMSTYLDIFNDLHPPRKALPEMPRGRDKAAELAAVNALRRAITDNKVGHAISNARVLLVLAGPAHAIKLMKRAGLLRSSKFAFNGWVIEKLLVNWIENASSYGLAAADLRYLSSARELCRLAPQVRKLHASIVARLNAGRTVILKTLLAQVDVAFAYPSAIDVGLGKERPVPREDLAEAFSYLLHLFQIHVGLAEEQFAFTDENTVNNDTYRMLLGDAVRVCRFREAETLLEGFPYQANWHPDGLRVDSVDSALERSICIGHIQNELQSNVHLVRLQMGRNTADAASLESFANEFFSRHGNFAAKLKESPRRRYRCQFPALRRHPFPA
jgi:hypothetical protein